LQGGVEACDEVVAVRHWGKAARVKFGVLLGAASSNDWKCAGAPVDSGAYALFSALSRHASTPYLLSE
jgi:hypothetical protein